MARIDALAMSIGRYLRKSETLTAASRATVRGGVLTGAVLAGSGAAIGYLISTVLGDGALYAAVGGGIGAAVGIIIGSMVSYSRMRRSMSIRAATVTLALTEKRLLVFRQSWFANRAADLLMEIPTGSITSLEVGPSRFISPHPITIALDNETVLSLEAAKIEKPDLLAEAFNQTTDR